MQSGNPADISSNLITPKDSAQYSLSVGRKFNCNLASNQSLFSCLQSKSTNSFMLQTYEFIYNYVDIFQLLTLDKNVFTQQPRRLIETGDFKRCDIMIGTNTHEFLMFISRRYITFNSLRQELIKNPGSLPYDFSKYIQRYNLANQSGFYDKIIEIYGLRNKSSSADFYSDYVALLTDEAYKCPTYLFAEQYSKFNQKAFVYLYGHKISTVTRPENGADHAEEIPFVFAEPLSSNSKYPVNERLFSEQMVNFWTSFIKFNNPNLQIIGTGTWNEFRTDASSFRNVYFLRAQNITATKYNVLDAECAFWNL